MPWRTKDQKLGIVKIDQSRNIDGPVQYVKLALNESTGYPSSDGTSLIPCENCGITPDFDMIENSITAVVDTSAQPASIACSACTYLNPIALRNCEMCGNRLPVKEGALEMPSPPDKRVKIELESNDGLSEDSRIFVQLSFRMSDGVLFSQTISELLVTQERAKVEKVYNKGAKLLNGSDIKPSNFNKIFDSDSKLNRVGISSLEKSQENKLIHNDIMLNNALSDLSSLMALASDIERLYNNMDKPEQQKASPILTVDREKFLTKELFIEEISRELHGFIMTEFQEQKQKEGVILITLVDIYALYNKAMRIGSGLVSPQELREACEKFEKIGLTDLQLTRINGRVLCVSSGDSFGFIKQKILDITATAPGADLLQLSKTLNDSYANSWTVGIIMEALNNCVNEGKLAFDRRASYGYSLLP